jgi:uncharacterized protein (DUF2062 family)
MLKWTTFFNVGLPLLIGSLFLAAPAALFFYFVLLAILKARHSRKLRRSAKRHVPGVVLLPLYALSHSRSTRV